MSYVGSLLFLAALQYNQCIKLLAPVDVALPLSVLAKHRNVGEDVTAQSRQTFGNEKDG
jgi:hypothetical protein